MRAPFSIDARPVPYRESPCDGRRPFSSLNLRFEAQARTPSAVDILYNPVFDTGER